MRLNDAVADLAPLTPPPCFMNSLEWREYLKSAAAVQNTRGEPKVIVWVEGEPAFNRDFDFCLDCTAEMRRAMEGVRRCRPDFLKEL